MLDLLNHTHRSYTAKTQYNGAKIIHTKNTLNPYIEINGKAYNCVNYPRWPNNRVKLSGLHCFFTFQISAVTNGNTRLLSGSVLVTDYFGDCPSSKGSQTTPSEDSTLPLCRETPYMMKTTHDKLAIATDTSYLATECNCGDLDEPQPVTLQASSIKAQLLLTLTCGLFTILQSLQ